MSQIKQPLAEVFGFTPDDFSAEAERYRRLKLCPYNNKVPNCTKDKAKAPLGVCSIHYDSGGQTEQVITCPVRFRQDWLIAEHAARFFFPDNAQWTSLPEVRLRDANGKSAGNIDLVLVEYDRSGKVVDFGSLEIQGVYISGNVRDPFEYYLENPRERAQMDWGSLGAYYPRPDYLSSSRKRLVPQLLYKGRILKDWNKRQAVAIQSGFYKTLPSLDQVDPEHADIAWFLYDLDESGQGYQLVLSDVVYTEFMPAIDRITTPTPGDVTDFVRILQSKLDDQNDANPPDAPLLDAIPLE